MLHYANMMVTAFKIKSKEIKTWLKNLRKRLKVLIFKPLTLEKTKIYRKSKKGLNFLPSATVKGLTTWRGLSCSSIQRYVTVLP